MANRRLGRTFSLSFLSLIACIFPWWSVGECRSSASCFPRSSSNDSTIVVVHLAFYFLCWKFNFVLYISLLRCESRKQVEGATSRDVNNFECFFAFTLRLRRVRWKRRRDETREASSRGAQRREGAAGHDLLAFGSPGRLSPRDGRTGHQDQDLVHRSDPQRERGEERARSQAAFDVNDPFWCVRF